MSTIDPRLQASAAESARLELGVAASAAARKNRPRVLVFLAILVLIGAAIYALVQFRARSAALADLETKRSRLLKIQQLSEEIDRLKKRESARGLDPDPRVASKLEMLAAGVNFTLIGPVSDSDAGSASGLVQRKYTARAQNQDPAAMLRWLLATQGPETPGLEIARVSLRPGGGEGSYNADIDFTRWEKRK